MAERLDLLRTYPTIFERLLCEVIDQDQVQGGGRSNPNPNCLRHFFLAKFEALFFLAKCLVGVQENRGGSQGSFDNVQIEADFSSGWDA